MSGIDELAEEIFEMPVRIGCPHGLTGLGEMVESPIYATSVGLIKYGAETNLETTILKNENSEKRDHEA